ncbi:helix-turn-helix domain-containing protein [Halobacteria archaeon AArc-m2/3/4]|uniref:Helix-turn-helix domain-containing protein n=1 Tax=Natronoglomus mannanivorans TaxID=2979990 RepID=A0AAP2Z277_9EURY|nr:helix-turn-helix domain-containing protein [Halobacteria archaeon AArc-xg1-1]MCU4972166.1 helix-turn-helix domain-containing protein [Halobacteria archaeon AArc-m2/3/4]
MALIAEFSVPTDAFPLGRVFEALPRETTIELERIVPTCDTLFPYVWIHGVSVRTVERALEMSGMDVIVDRGGNGCEQEGSKVGSFSDSAADALTDERSSADAGAGSATDADTTASSSTPTNTHTGLSCSFTLLEDLGERGLLFRVTWGTHLDGIVTAITTSAVTLLSASCRNRTWTFRLRVDDHAEISHFRETCLENGVRISLTRLQSLGSTDGRDDELTEPQLEALGLAFERGYFDDPRRATLDELAAELDITRQSFAGRLRRGHRNVLARVFAAEPQPFAGIE